MQEKFKKAYFAILCVCSAHHYEMNEKAALEQCERHTHTHQKNEEKVNSF